ncbi:MAG: glycosyltransferase family 2 protein [Alphaproteobacteria bacterium]
MKIAVVLPCFRVARHLEAVVSGLPARIDRILVVDDACPEGSGDLAQALASRDARVEVIRHAVNRGVGAATVTGYRRALELGCEIVVKMDGDGQMDPDRLPDLLEPVLSGRVDYAKGNRFKHVAALRTMPRLRLFGNSLLSFLVKAASGQWSVMDPTNGFTAIHARALETIALDRLSPRYFFECDLLIALGTAGLPVEDVAMPARYGAEDSSLRIGQVLAEFPPLLLHRFFQRILVRYFVADFTVVSLYLLLGLPMLGWGIGWGLTEWTESVRSGVTRSAGTVMVAALPTLLGFQLLLQAVAQDIRNTPQPRRGLVSDPRDVAFRMPD